MKKLLFTALLLPLIGMAQPYAEFGGGINSNHYRPLMKIAAGYVTNNISVEALMQATVTRAINSPTYFGLKAGYHFKNFVPGIGYYYNHLSADNKALNHNAVGYSIKYIYEIGEPGGLFAEAMYIEKAMQATIGFHVNF